MALMALLGSLPVFLIASVVPGVAVGFVAFLVLAASAVSWFTWRGMRSQFRSMIARVQTRLELLLDDEEQGRLQASPTLLEKMLKGI